MAFCIWKNQDKESCLSDGKRCRFRIIKCAMQDVWRSIKKAAKRPFVAKMIITIACAGLVWGGVAIVDNTVKSINPAVTADITLSESYCHEDKR